ncbi:MAG: glycosyltransferase [Verrucomicrobiota bacterium JB023]|nr:glycosyltransferase [Verrucomicrobiota bacterium JB023]
MKIAIITDNHHPGGANVACHRLIRALLKQGVGIVHASLEPSPAPSIKHENYRPLSLFGGAARDLSKVSERFLGVGPALWVNRKDLSKQVRKLVEREKPDGINLHNLHASNLALNLLQVLPLEIPVFWTLHDMWSFTGRCAYSFNCRKFIDTSCDSTCPTSQEYPSLAPPLIAPAIELRRQFFESKRRLTAICPSRWLAREAELGLWKSQQVEVVANGLDTDCFRPTVPSIARQALRIPDDGRPVFLSSAANFSERRKGGLTLGECLERWKAQKIVVVFLGGASPEVSNPRVETISLGYLHDDVTKALAYSAADLLVHPAPVDNLPNVVLESFACGTPVAAFDIGGLSDMVRPGETGWLAGMPESGALMEMLLTAIKDPGELGRLSENCRKVALSEYSEEVLSSGYLQVFKSEFPN